MGTGTVCTEQQTQSCLKIMGCQFTISPGATEEFTAGRGKNASIPFLPGIASVSELMRGYGVRAPQPLNFSPLRRLAACQF